MKPVAFSLDELDAYLGSDDATEDRQQRTDFGTFLTALVVGPAF